MKVLVTGGSGYLGQFVVKKLASDHEVVSTWHSCEPEPGGSSNTTHVQCDLASVPATRQLFDTHGPFHAVVNTAAISQPGVCQQDPDRARAINVPIAVLAALRSQQDTSAIEAILVHLSTDQVYDGSRPLSSEADPTAPVNAYGHSKVAAEACIREQWPRHVILRSSIIYGPQSPAPVARPLFVQFVEEALRTQKPCKFFSDEYRSPIAVSDLTAIIHHAISSPPPQLEPTPAAPTDAITADAPTLPGAEGLVGTFNAGGPDRLSRLGIAEAVAAHCGHSMRSVEAAASASVTRAAPSPLDISMDSGKLAARLPFDLTPFAAALAELFPPAA